jgi:hypothetical protein
MKTKILSFVKNLDEADVFGIKVVFVGLVIAVSLYTFMYFDIKQNPESYMRYSTVCINDVLYIQDTRNPNTPLVPSYKPDGTINECGVNDE